MKTWGDIDERLDPLFYLNMMLLNKNIIQQAKHSVSTFKQKVNMQRGRFGHRPRNDPRYYGGEYPFIQTGNIVKASTANEKIEFTQTLNELGLSTSRLFNEKVLVITIAANIGYTAILDYAACFPDSLVALTSKDDSLSLKYLNEYIRLIRTYIENLAPQAAQKNINLKQLDKLPIIIPNRDVQNEIIAIMEKAYSEKTAKENRAEALLSSINDYLLQELGISMPLEEENSLESRLFYVNANKFLDERFDPFYHKPTFNVNLQNIKDCKYGTINLKTIITGELIKGILPSKTQKDGKCKVIQITNINIDGTIETAETLTAKSIYLPKHQLKMGDVLIAITGATIGKVGFWEYEGEYYLGGDIVKFNTGNYYLNQIYAALLRTPPYQSQIKKCITGATNGHLALKDIEQLPLPNITDKKVQQTLANQLASIRAEIQLIEKEIQNTVSYAKAQAENILLGRSL